MGMKEELTKDMWVKLEVARIEIVWGRADKVVKGREKTRKETKEETEKVWDSGTTQGLPQLKQ